MSIEKYKFTGENKFHISKFDTGDIGKYEDEKQTNKSLEENILRIAQLQDRLFAEEKNALLIIFQAMDAAGKDGGIKHVLSGINPQGVDVHCFKQPSPEELSHDYLWRAVKDLPPRGKIGIFNRSYYEDVLVVKVHQLYLNQNLPDRCKGEDIIEKRYKQIRNFEEYLNENGISTVKIFLHVSKEEQKKRFLKRINNKEKNWKFSADDLKEREYWDHYQDAYEKAINATATEHNPWYVVPADKKWYTRAVISDILLGALKEIDPQYPAMSDEKLKILEECKKSLMD